MENNSGKALERLVALFDEESFVEIGALSAAEVVTGYGLIDGAVVYAFSENGSGMTGAAADKIKKLYENAVKNGFPVIAVYDSKGGDVKDGRRLLAAYGNIAEMCARLSGVVPQSSVVAGLCAGAAAVVCCMADFVIMTEKAELFITPPFLSEDSAARGGSSEAASSSGTAAFVEKDEAAALEKARSLIKILPPNNLEISGNDYFEENDAVITDALNARDLADAIADKDSLIEVCEGFGDVFTALGSISWRAVGFVAAYGRLSADDCVKTARFVGFCDAFSIPVLTLTDSEGFKQSSEAELTGFMRDAAKLTQTYATAVIPKISLITGSAVGGAFVALSSMGDITLAYENAVIYPIMPNTAAVFMGKDFNEDEVGALCAAKEGFIDRVIKPENARTEILSALDVLSGKRVVPPPRKHVSNL
ncbi:MAG: acetyl-CoA carboxylase [Oscillospiraceae bacterium]|nr:acetyl-CoA carboxylase [Oscillospiraceae bacterium]